MKIVLCENVENLGSVGDVVKVRDGYARNFLIPHAKAVVATNGNIKVIEREKVEEIKKERESRAAAQTLADKIQSVSISIEAEAGDEGKLFGSITANEIHEALAKLGVEVDKKQIRISRPIRKIGAHDIEVRCYNNVKAHVRIQVTKKFDPNAKKSNTKKVKVMQVISEAPDDGVATEDTSVETAE